MECVWEVSVMVDTLDLWQQNTSANFVSRCSISYFPHRNENNNTNACSINHQLTINASLYGRSIPFPNVSGFNHHLVISLSLCIYGQERQTHLAIPFSAALNPSMRSALSNLHHPHPSDLLLRPPSPLPSKANLNMICCLPMTSA